MQELEQANHDPQVFEQPETFDITRAGRAHMGFGVGLHACLGASLGRLQARLYLQALLEAGRVELLEENPAWERHSMFRRLARLPLRFS
jgi:cytochrome P450